MDRVILADAFDLAGSANVRLVNDPGWWAACVAAAYVNFGLPVVVQRVVDRLERHARVLVADGRLAELYPEWPMVVLFEGGPELDLRGETALRLGPADVELEAYALAQKVEGVDVAGLRRMFDLGVIGWESGDVASGRRRLVPAP